MKALLIVWKKELLELVRDRRTLALTLLFAPLLGPLLFLGLATIGESKAKEQMEKPMSIAITGADRARDSLLRAVLFAQINTAGDRTA